MAIREDETAAAAMGIDTVTGKLLASPGRELRALPGVHRAYQTAIRGSFTNVSSSSS